jgi:WD40 repeat protein
MKLAHVLFLVFLLSVSSITCLAQRARLVIPSGHTNPVAALAIDKDQKILATSEQSNSIKFWDIETRNELYSFHGHTEAVNDIAFSPVGNLIASASDDKFIFIWNMQRSARQSTLAGHTDAVRCIKFTKDGNQLISASYDGSIKVWNVTDASLIREIDTGSPIHSLAFSHSEEWLAYGTRNGDLVTVNFLTGEQIQSVQLGTTLNDIQISIDDSNLLVADNSGKVSIVGVPNMLVTKSIQAFDYRAYKIEFSGDEDTFMVVGRDSRKNTAFYNLDGEQVNLQLELEEAKSPGFYIGINTVLFNKEKTKLFLPNYSGCVRVFDFPNNIEESPFCGKAKPITSFSVDANGRYMAIASKRPDIFLMDLTGSADARMIAGHSGSVSSIAFHPTQNRLVSSGDNTLKVWDTNSWVPVTLFPTDANYAGTPIYFDKTSSAFYKRSDEDGIHYYDFEKNSISKINLRNRHDFRISPDGKTIVVKTPNTLTFYNSPKFNKPVKSIIKGVSGYDFFSDSQIAITNGEHIKIFDVTSKREIKSFPLTVGEGADRIKVIPWKNLAITWRTSVDKLSTTRDFNLRVWDLSEGKLISSLQGHSGSITAVEVVNNHFVFSSSMDGTIRIWSLDEKDKTPYRASLIPLDDTNWVVTTPLGLFDATSEAMHMMHYAQGKEIIDIDQLKKTYYEPYLLSKILGYNQEQIRPANELSELALYPEINLLHPQFNNGVLGIDLVDQGGGYGQVIIMINDKEVIEDLTQVVTVDKSRPELSLTYSLDGHPYLKEDDLNKVTVKAYNKVGDLVSRPKNVFIIPEKDKSDKKSKLYALFAGVSDYKGTELDLKFAAKDARDMAEALRLSALKNIVYDDVDIHVLTTDNEDPLLRPNKKNIINTLDYFSKNASANDVLFIYLAGHGVNINEGEKDFYFLTSDADKIGLSDADKLKVVGISSTELTVLIKKIPAIKQVMIIDACHSGQLAGNLDKGSSHMNSSQVRAMETLKDRTGLYVLAGSAADAVSYEASAYNQGVMTYSLLFGLKGPALRENGYIDVVRLFQYSIEKAPQIATDLGRIQKPEMRIPSKATSFDIGKISEIDRQKIVLSQPKPVFIQSDFQEENQLFDVVELSMEVDNELRLIANGGVGRLFFSNTRRLHDGYSIRGRYVDDTKELTAIVRIFNGNRPLFEYSCSASNVKELAKMIVQRAIEMVDP